MEEKKTPEALLAEEAKRKELVAKAKAKIEAVKVALNSASEDANVRVVLQYVAELCGSRSNPVVLNAEKEITNATNYNVGRLSVICDLRKLMSAETENLIERREE